MLSHSFYLKNHEGMLKTAFLVVIEKTYSVTEYSWACRIEAKLKINAFYGSLKFFLYIN